MSNEEWRPCVLSGGYFDVSSIGRVRCASRKEKILKGMRRPDGIIAHAQRISGKWSKNWLAHRMIAEVFIPGHTAERDMVNHRDGNPSNNHPENLEWVNRSENTLHARHVLGLNRGESSSKAKLNEDQVLTIYTMTMNNPRTPDGTYPAIVKAFGVSVVAVCNVKCGTRWKWLYKAIFGPPEKITNSALELGELI